MMMMKETPLPGGGPAAAPLTPAAAADVGVR